MRIFSLILLFAAALFASTSAKAVDIQVVFVNAIDGVNNATCGDEAAPCKTLAFAKGRVLPGGSIILMTPGDYGPGGTFTQSVNIIGVPGAVIMRPNAPCLTFNGVASAVLNITNLICDQDGGLFDGFVFMGGHKGRLTNVVARGAGGAKCGVRVNPSAGTFEIIIIGGIFSENGTSGTDDGGGICLRPTDTAILYALMYDLYLQNNRHGLIARVVQSAVINALLMGADISRNVGGIDAVGANAAVCVRNATIALNTFMALFGTGLIYDGGKNLLFGNVGSEAFDGPCPPLL
jgi:hypothetical protein